MNPSGGPGVTPASCDLVITNAYLITMDPRRSVYRRGAVAIDGRDIVMVGPEAAVHAQYRGCRSIDARGGPVHPGFIDAHYHVPNQLTRGVFPDTAAMSDYYLCYARWYERSFLRSHQDDDSFRMPRRDSIARRLIEDWLRR